MESTSPVYTAHGAQDVTCDSTPDSYVFSSSLHTLVPITAVVVVIALFTVLANCGIIVAVIRAYMYGISCTAFAPRKSVTGTLQKYRKHTRASMSLETENQRIAGNKYLASARYEAPSLAAAAQTSTFTPDTCKVSGCLTGPNSSLGVNRSAAANLDRTAASEENEENRAASERATLTEPVRDIATRTSTAGVSNTRNHSTGVINTRNNSTGVINTRNNSTGVINTRTNSTALSATTHERSRTCQSRGLHPFGATRNQARVRLGNDTSNIPIILMVSMAVSDALLGAAIMPLSAMEIMHSGTWPLGSLTCELRMFLDVILSTTSIYHVTCMAGDRYLAVCQPFLHQKLSGRTALVAVAFCWTLPIAMTSLFQIPGASSITAVDYTSGDCSGQSELSTVSSGISWLSSNTSLLKEPKHVFLCEQNLSLVMQSLSVVISFYIPFIIIIGLYSLIMIKIRGVSKKRELLKGKSTIKRPGEKCFREKPKQQTSRIFLKNPKKLRQPMAVIGIRASDKVTGTHLPPRDQHVEDHEKEIDPGRECKDMSRLQTVQDTKQVCGAGQSECQERSTPAHHTSHGADSQDAACPDLNNETSSRQGSSCFGESDHKEISDCYMSDNPGSSIPDPAHSVNSSAAGNCQSTTQSNRASEAEENLDHQYPARNLHTAKSHTDQSCGNSWNLGQPDGRDSTAEGRDTGTASHASRAMIDARKVSKNGHNKAELGRAKSHKGSASKSLKAAKTIGLVVVCFTVCWLPFSVFCLASSVRQKPAPYWVQLLITWLGYLNSSLNPLLYCGHVTVRAALRDLFIGKA